MASESVELLDTQQQGLLLALLLFASREHEELLSYLPKELAQHLSQAASPLIAMERNKRIQLLVAQLKHLLTYQSQSLLFTVEPSWVVNALKNETPFIADAILTNLPPQLRRQIAQREEMPAPEEKPAKLDAELKNVLLRSFERQFAAMPYEEFSSRLRFRHLVLLRARDLILLARELGRVGLATALAQLGMQNAAHFLSHYSQATQDEIINGVKGVEADDVFDEQKTKQFLGVVFASFHNVEDLFQKAGLFWLALSVNERGERLVRQIAQRFPYAHGQILIEYRKFIVQNKLIASNITAQQNQVLLALVEMSKNKQIDERFSQCLVV